MTRNQVAVCPAHRPTLNRSCLAATIARFSDSSKDPRRSTVLSGGDGLRRAGPPSSCLRIVSHASPGEPRRASLSGAVARGLGLRRQRQL